MPQAPHQQQREMPTRLRLSCRALLIIVIVAANFYSAGPQASHQLNPALVQTQKVLRNYHILSQRVYHVSAVFAVVLCLSVCPSQAGNVSKQLDESSLFLARSLPSTCPTLCYNKTWVFSVALVPNYGLQNFDTESPSRCQKNSSTVELVDDAYTTIDESWLFTTSRLGQL